MWKSFVRLLKVIGYTISGNVDAKARLLATNPHAMNAMYDEVIQEKKKRFSQFLSAMAEIVRISEGKKSELIVVSTEVVQFERRIRGATKMAQERFAEMQAQGKSQEEALGDLEMIRLKTALSDMRSTLAEKQKRVAGLENDLAGHEAKLKELKVSAEGLQRELETIKAEKGEAVADVITAQQEEQANKLLAGISTDGTSKTLESLREMRGRAKAEAQVSRVVAGVDAKKQMAEFDAFAQSSEHDADFLKDLGIAPTPEKKDAPAADTKAHEGVLPE